jgi:hypothetical protein
MRAFSETSARGEIMRAGMLARFAIALFLTAGPGWFGPSSSLAQFNGCPAGFCNGSPGSGARAFGIAYQQFATTQSCSTVGSATTCTFTAQNIGSVDPTRIVAVGLIVRPSGTIPTVTSIGLSGGATASLSEATGAYTVNASSDSFVSDIWYAPVASGTSATITVVLGNTSPGITRVSIATWSVTGTGAAFSAANGGTSVSSTSVSTSVAVPSGGGSVIVSSLDNTPTAGSPTNYSADFNDPAAGGSTNWILVGHDTSHSGSTTYTSTVTGSPGFAIMSAAAFSP